MLDIRDLKNRHKGEEIAILANGLSLHQDIEDLKTERITTIGVNSSWKHYSSTYQILLDHEQVENLVKANHLPDNLIIGNHKYIWKPPDDSVYRVNMFFHRKMQFSKDISKGVHVCRSSTWCAIQLAHYLGADRVYIMGLDLGGQRVLGHPKGSQPLPEKSKLAQYELMGYLRNMIDRGDLSFKVYISHRSKSLLRSIPRIKYLTRAIELNNLYGLEDDELKVVKLQMTPEQLEKLRDHLSKRTTQASK